MHALLQPSPWIRLSTLPLGAARLSTYEFWKVPPKEQFTVTEAPVTVAPDGTPLIFIVVVSVTNPVPTIVIFIVPDDVVRGPAGPVNAISKFVAVPAHTFTDVGVTVGVSGVVK